MAKKESASVAPEKADLPARVHHTVSNEDLYQGPTPEGPWWKCEELPAPESTGGASPRRAWKVTDKYTHLGK